MYSEIPLTYRMTCWRCARYNTEEGSPARHNIKWSSRVISDHFTWCKLGKTLCEQIQKRTSIPYLKAKTDKYEVITYLILQVSNNSVCFIRSTYKRNINLLVNEMRTDFSWSWFDTVVILVIWCSQIWQKCTQKFYNSKKYC